MDFSLVQGKCSVVCGDHVYCDMDSFFLEAQDRFYFTEVSVCVCVQVHACMCVRSTDTLTDQWFPPKSDQFGSGQTLTSLGEDRI